MNKQHAKANSTGTNPAPPPYNYDVTTADPTNYGYNQPGDVKMLEPGQVNMMRFAEPMPSNTAALIVSVISIFFCICLGVPATIIADKARESGNPQIAKNKLNQALGLAIAAIVVGLVITCINIALRTTVLARDDN